MQNIVVRQVMTILQLFTGKDRMLPVRRKALLAFMISMVLVDSTSKVTVMVERLHEYPQTLWRLISFCMF
jgi:hypothetical protein